MADAHTEQAWSRLATAGTYVVTYPFGVTRRVSSDGWAVTILAYGIVHPVGGDWCKQLAAVNHV